MPEESDLELPMGTASVSIGGSIRSWCTRCREMRDHVIAVVEEDRPRRVTCSTCNGTHLYRPQPPRTRARSTAPSTGTEITGWDDLMAVADLERVRSYAMRETFATGDVISHKVFGLGIVVREVDDHKIKVSFQDGIRLLACNHRR